MNWQVFVADGRLACIPTVPHPQPEDGRNLRHTAYHHMFPAIPVALVHSDVRSQAGPYRRIRKTEQSFGDGSIRIARPERALWERRPQRERVRLGRIDCSGNHPVGPHGQGTDLMEEETEVSEVAG